MHLKTNIEHSPVQIIVLAICPLLLAVSSLNDAILMASGTILCLVVSQLLLIIFNRYLNNDVKILITALISAMIVVILSIVVEEFTDRVLPDNSYLMVFSATILNAEFIYFNNKALTKHYFLNILKNLIIFSLILVVYSVFKEFMAFGSIYDKQLFEFSGFNFCKTIIFDLLWLASLCAISDYIVRYIDKKIETKNMIYQKYVKIIRAEKAFQYDKLRREKLLANEIEINRINKVDSEKIKQKQAENEVIESVSEVVAEEENIVEPKEDDEESVANETEEKVIKKAKKAGKKSKKKNKKEDKK